MTKPALELSGYGVAYRERVVLAEVDLVVPARGVTVLLGPAGGGKSTLVRTLAGFNEQPHVRQWGTARYEGQALGPRRPALVHQDMRYVVATVRENLLSALADRRLLTRAEQNARLISFLEWAGTPDLIAELDCDAVMLSTCQRRLLAVLRAMLAQPALVCVDEATSGLEEPCAERVLSVLRRYGEEHAVLFVTHQQAHARACARGCALLAGGRVQEHSEVSEFFGAPRSPETARFLTTGSSPLPSPDAAPETLAEGVPPPPPLPVAARVAPAWTGPSGFHWLIPGKLGGLPRPGIVGSLESDLAGLERLGVSTLVTLEETATVSGAALARSGIESLHVPIPDMGVPAPQVLTLLFATLEARLAGGGTVGVHCRAGHGRTGTVLACFLIWRGETSVDALERVRSVNPRWVTSEVQVEFLEAFALALRLFRSTVPSPSERDEGENNDVH